MIGDTQSHAPATQRGLHQQPLSRSSGSSGLIEAALGKLDDAVLVADADDRIVYINQAAERLMGVAQSRVVGEPVAHTLPPSGVLADQVQAGVAQARQKGTGCELGPVLLQLDGSEEQRWLLLRVTPLAPDDSLVVVLRDVSASVRAERRQRLQAEIVQHVQTSPTTQQALEQIANCLVQDFADWCVIDIDMAASGLTRVAAAQDNAKHGYTTFLEAYQPVQASQHGTPTFYPDLRALAEAGVFPEHVDTSQLWPVHSLICVPLLAQNHLLGACTLVRTINAVAFSQEEYTFVQQLAQEIAHVAERAHLQHAAQQAHEDREHFFSMAAHELKTPLTALLGYAALLQRRIERGAPLGEREVQSLQTMMEQGRRLDTLINSLLRVAHLMRMPERQSRERLNIVALVRGLVEATHAAAPAHTLEFSASSELLFVDGNKAQIEEAIQHLLQNAIKYSPSGGIITVRVSQDHDMICIAVKDPGIGIAGDALPHVFERYYRVMSDETRHIYGMGIGLYVVDEIVKQHYGSIEVASVPGHGSTFSIMLPREGHVPQSDAEAVTQ